MAVGEERRGKEATVDKFPVGMRVLAVDDNPVCLKLLVALLRRSSYHATTAGDAETALKMLREGKDQFDLVISDVHMLDMDGFKLLELIGLEMDLPVIMLSANEDTKTVMKGITHGACDYLVKPVHAKELKNIWKHVLRRRKFDLRNLNNSGNYDADQKVQSGIAESEKGDAKLTRKYSRKTRNTRYDSNENKDNTNLPTQKKPRVKWTSALHRKFVEVVNQIGIEKAVPKKITNMMNVDYITKESVGSHLQKYRQSVKRLNAYTSRKSVVDASERWNSSHTDMNDLENFKYYHEHGRWQPSLAFDSSISDIHFGRMNSPSALGAHGLLPTQSIQHRNAHVKLGVGAVVHGGLKDIAPKSLPSDARKLSPSGPYANTLANISNGMMLDASNNVPSCLSGNSYANILRGELLEANKGIPSCYSGNSFTNIPNIGILAPADQFSLQSHELANQPSVQMNSSSTYPFNTPFGNASQFVDHGNCSNSWQAGAPAKFFDLGHMGETSLGLLQANIPKIDQLTSFAASSSQIPMFENKPKNQMTTVMENTVSMVRFNEKMSPINLGSNPNSIEIMNGNFALGSDSSIMSTLPNLQIDNSMTSIKMLNGGNASGILPVQDGTIDQQAVDDKLNYSNDFFIQTNEPDGGGNTGDNVANLLNQDFIEDDASMDGDWYLHSSLAPNS